MPVQPASLANLRPPWTPETARHAAAHSNALQTARRLNAPPPPDIQPDPPESPAETLAFRVRAQLSLVREQIRVTRVLLNSSDYRYCPHCKRSGVEPHHRAQLLRAVDVLLDRERKLLGIPDPGVRRQPKHPERVIDLDPVPLAMAVETEADVAPVAEPTDEPAPDPPAQGSASSPQPPQAGMESSPFKESL